MTLQPDDETPPGPLRRAVQGAGPVLLIVLGGIVFVATFLSYWRFAIDTLISRWNWLFGSE